MKTVGLHPLGPLRNGFCYLPAALRAAAACFAIRDWRRAAWFLWITPDWTALSRCFWARTRFLLMSSGSPAAVAFLDFLTYVLSAVRVEEFCAVRFALLLRSFFEDFVFAIF